jgi:hypothetical protein
MGGKAGDQALRRSSFQEAISHLRKSIAVADKAWGSLTPRAAAGATSASASQRLKLQTNLGKTLMWSKGFASSETKAAFSRAQELVAYVDDSTERFDTYYGLLVGSLV